MFFHVNDARCVLQVWIQDKVDRNSRHSYVWNNAQFDAVDPDNTDHLLGPCYHSNADVVYT